MDLHSSTHKDISPIKYSLSHRFSYILTGVVTCIVLVFSTIIILARFFQAETQLKEQLEHTVQLAETSLASAVWQFNPASIEDILRAMFTDEAVVYTQVISEGDILAEKTRPDFSHRDLSFFEASRQFLTLKVDIQKDDMTIGLFQLAFSRNTIRQKLIQDIAVTLLLTILIILTISVTSIIITRRYILHPLAALSHLATSITNGKLDVSIMSASNVTEHHDEIGELARAFEKMRKRLQELIAHIRNAAEMMQSSSDEIFMVVNQLAIALEEQSASVLETTATMESITSTSRKISENTDSVARMAEHTRIHSQKGVTMAEETIRKMGEIQETNTQFLQKMIILGERSEKIGNIIEIISDIADRTKLIAFNAALEAVGAGDAGGKRFNVVAGEIRRLADSIIESTQEINSNILEIQQGMRELALVSDVTTRRISEGARQTETTNDWLQDILKGAIRTTDEAKQIAFATQEQQRAKEQILPALKEISDTTRFYASTSNQLSHSADEMKRLANTLHERISNFGFPSIDN